MRNATNCPIESTAQILGSRWTLQIIHHLRQPRRYCELQDLVGAINPTTFSQRLRFLEDQGLIQRLPIQPARHGVYQLTEMGRALIPALDEISTWANRWLLVGESELSPSPLEGDC